MTPLAKLRLYVVSADPGLVTLRMSVRILLTAAAVCLALIVLGRWFPMSPSSYAIGLISAIQGAIQIRGRTAAGRALTRAYAALGGFIAIAGISVVEKSLAWTGAWLMVVIFLVAYGRRFGPRWQAVGVFTFMCGVLGAFIKVPERDLSAVVLALIVSGVVAHLVREYVMPERPARDFRRVVNGTISLSGQLRRMIADGAETRTGMRWNDALHITKQLRNDIRMCQDYLPLKVEGPGAERSAAIARRLLDLQLASESALEACAATQLHGRQADPGRVGHELDAMKESEARFQAAVAKLPATFPERVNTAPPAPPARPFPARGEWLKDRDFRLALQVTLACAIAMVGGALISAQRWFWAVLSAFLIFMNTQSAGGVMVRGLGRAMGTLAGIVLGIGLATLVQGNLYATIPLVAIFAFGAFYLARISYTGLNICITVAIALAYGLVGIFTPDLLVLRLKETAIGAAAGIFAALVVLPVHTGHVAEQARNRFLLSLRDFIDLAVKAGGAGQDKSLTTAANAMDKALAALVKAYDPLLSFWTMGMAGAGAHAPLHRAYILAHAAHVLEHSFRDTKPTDAEVHQLQAISERLGAIAGEDPAADHASPASGGSDQGHRTGPAVTDDPVWYALNVMMEILRQMEADE